MNERTLRWISVVVPTTSVVVFELLTHVLFYDSVPVWVNVAVAFGGVTIGAFAFSAFMFSTMGRLERELRERNRRLALLNSVATAASESLDLDEVATEFRRARRRFRSRSSRSRRPMVLNMNAEKADAPMVTPPKATATLTQTGTES